MESIKCVVVGDGTVGKTCLLIAYTIKAFPQDYVPTVFDNYNAVVEWDGRPINLGLWDTAGQDDFEHMRPISYTSADIFLLFFAIDNPTSFHNVKYKWFSEVRKSHQDTPLMLIGTKSDIRDNDKMIEELKQKDTELITWKQGVKLAKELGCVTYIECSAITRKGFLDIFGQTILTILNHRHGKKPGSACWDTDCHNTFSVLSKKAKCIRCQHRYCNDHVVNLPKDHEWYPGAAICKKCKVIDDDEGPMIKPRNRGGLWSTGKKNVKKGKKSEKTEKVGEGGMTGSGGVTMNGSDEEEEVEGGGELSNSQSKKKGKKKDKKKMRSSSTNISG